MIPKSGNRFSEKVMPKQKINGGADSTQLNQARHFSLLPRTGPAVAEQFARTVSVRAQARGDQG
jgi:hypothetical protein